MSNDDPISAYRARVDSGSIHADASQAGVVDRLQKLHEALRRSSNGIPVLQRLSQIFRYPGPFGMQFIFLNVLRPQRLERPGTHVQG